MTNAAGTVEFQPEGAPAAFQYNAIAYNLADNYLYGISLTAGGGIPAGAFIRIGEDGVITRVGTSLPGGFINGTFGPDGLYYAANNVGTNMVVLNPVTGALVRTVTLSAEAGTADLTLAYGFFWASNATAIVRINPTTGQVSTFPNPITNQPDATAGAAWTFGNGNLGFSANATGLVTQIAVTNPASATPTFTIVSQVAGPASGNNDGAASPGQPTDLSIVKTGPTSLVPGTTATYTLTVTNNGPGNSSGFIVNDSVPAPLTSVASPDGACTVTGNDVQCVGGRLLAGASVSYTVTASVPAGMTAGVENTATVTSNETDPTPGNNTSTTTAAPAGISMVKNAGTPVDVNANGLVDIGDTIQYTFDVENTGLVEMTDFTIADPKVGAITCPEPSLAPGASQTCAADAVYAITAADVENGSVDNSATATGTTPDGDPITSTPSTTSTPTTAAAPGISVVKAATPSDEDSFTAGQEVTYSFTVTNTGNVPLNEVEVIEGDFTGTGDLSDVTCPEPSLAVGEQQVCTATYTLTQADVDAGSVTNSATAEGTPPGSDTPVPSTPSNVTIPTPAAPGITVVKTASAETIASAGDEITYSFRITNTGNVTLTDVAVDETDFSGTGELSAAECPTTTVVPAQIITCTATYVVTQADVDSGALTNTATAGGTTPEGDPIDSDPSEVEIPVDEAPALSVVKSSDVESITAAGQAVTFSFLVTNTGNVTITDPTVAEGEFSGTGELSAIVCPAEDTLAPAATITCTATYVVTQADVDSGALSNVATVTGTTPTGDPTDPSDPSEVEIPVEQAPALTVVKSSDVETITAAGETVTFSFLVTNTGNVTITDPTINDVDFSGTGELSEIVCPAEDTLAPAATITCTAAYVVTQADVDSGELTNTATVTGTTPGGDRTDPSDPSDVEIPVDEAPSLTVVKSSDVESITAAGQTVTFSFLVTNTGNVTITDPTINEVDFSGTGELSEIVCPAEAPLAPEATITCTATYVVTQADVDSGELTNTATVTGTTPTGDPTDPSDPSEVEIPAEPAPSLTVVKSADVVAAEAGQTVTFSFLVTNTGNVTITDPTINDVDFSGTGELSEIVCPAEDTLAPAATITCTATYVVTQADVDSGELTNTATVTGTTPTGDPTDPSDPSTEVITTDPLPALSVVKTADVVAAEAGQTVTYSFLVTNIGNVTITDPTVNEVEFSGTGELSAIVCPDEEPLAPGADITCTATYVVTQADVDSGELTNTATASGTTPTGDPVGSDPSTETVTTDPLPALSVVKTADVETITRVGQTLTYSFLVTNTGNVTIADAVINDTEFSGNGELSEIVCPEEAATLEPGAQVTCTATYTVVAADLTQETLTNTATVSGTTPGGEPLTSTPSTVTIDEITPPVTPGEPTNPGGGGGTPTIPGGTPDDGLAITGGALAPGIIALSAMLLILGGVLVMARRRSEESAAIGSID